MDCPAFQDDEETCVCGMPVCPSCKGSNSREEVGTRFREALRLLGRANQVLKLELSATDREFVIDLVHRLSDGSPPRRVDFFKLQEIYDRGNGSKKIVYVPSDYPDAQLPEDVEHRHVSSKKSTSRPNLKLLQGGDSDHVVAAPKEKSKDPRRDPD